MATTYTDYKLDSVGDRVIESASFVLIEDEEVLKQQLETNLQLVKKDWFLNLDEGIGMFGNSNEEGILGATTLTAEQEAQFQTECTRIDGISQILDFNFNVKNHLLTVNITVISVFGEIEATTTITI